MGLFKHVFFFLTLSFLFPAGAQEFLAGADAVLQEPPVLSFMAHDAAKGIRRLKAADYPGGQVTLALTGSCNTYLLSRIKKSMAAASSLRFTLDLSAVTGMEALDREVLSDCINLTAVVISPSMQDINPSAFSGCRALTRLSAPEESAFFSSRQDGLLYSKDGSRLVLVPPGLSGAVTLPLEVTAVESGAFSESPLVTEILVEEGGPEGQGRGSETAAAPGAAATRVAGAAPGAVAAAFSSVDGILYSADMTRLVRCPRGRQEAVSLPDSVTVIGRGAFEGCSRLLSVSFPTGSAAAAAGGQSGRGLEALESLAFSGCSSLRDLVLPDGLSSIGKQAFLGCTSLETLTIPASVTFVGSRAFYHNRLSLLAFQQPEGWTNGKRALTDLADGDKNPVRFNHPEKYWPNDIWRSED